MLLINLKFTFRRIVFRMLLALEPRLLRWFKWLLTGFVAFSVLTVIAFWMLVAPRMTGSISVELESLPPNLDTSILTLPPFSELNDYATRPVPMDDTQILTLSQ